MIDKPNADNDDGAPETFNDEQEDEGSQAQEIAEEARKRQPDEDRATESKKKHRDSDDSDDSSQDLVDRMKDMEQSGRIDMSAYRGEDNLDDNEDKYDRSNRVDDLPSDGS